MVDIARLAGRQVILEDAGNVAGDADHRQVAGEMGARDQARVADEAHGTLQDAGDADGGERFAHPAGACHASAAKFFEAGAQGRESGIETEADDMDRQPVPSD